MSAIDDLTTVPDQPQISEGNKTFSQKTFALWLWIRTKLVPAMVELRDLIVNSVTGSYSGVSNSSVTIVDTGEVSITTDAGRSFKPGTPVRLAYVSDPRIYIDGITKTYNSTSGAFVLYAQAKAGSGTFTNWSLSIIPSGGGLAGLGSNTYTGAQYVPDDAYDATGWNGSAAVPTKNAIRDKIEAIIAGLFQLETAATDSGFTSVSPTNAASPQWVNGRINVRSLGLAQTYQDVGASRAASTTYTNSTGKAIYLSITFSGSGGASLATLAISGIPDVVKAYPNSAGTPSFTLQAIIPNGGTYSISLTSATISKWLELRT